MSIDFEDFNQAYQDARTTIRVADAHVGKMAQMIAGRLRKGDVSVTTLCELKKELADFNMHTKQWSR